MKPLLLAGVLLFCAYQIVLYVRRPDPPPPLYPTPYVVVYGREACGYTRRMRKALTEAGVKFEYQVVDDPAVASVLHDRMIRSGIDVEHYYLPVVDVSGEISVRPDAIDVIDEMRYAL